MSVREDIQIGDKVWGVVPPHKSGCHAEYVVVDESCVRIQIGAAQKYFLWKLKNALLFRFHTSLKR